MSSIKILFVAPISLDYPNGVSIYVLELVKKLSISRQCEVGLLSVCSKGRPVSRIDNLTRCLIIDGPKKYHWNPWALNPIWLSKIIERFGLPDIVHFHDLYEPFEIALARLMVSHSWPYIISPHGGFHSHAQARKPLKKIIGNSLFLNSFIRKAEAIHALNDEERNIISKRFPESKIFNIPNGVSDEFFYAEAKKTVNKDTLIFGFIGRIDIKHKGIDILLKAITKLQQEKHDFNAKFVFAGPFHSKKDEKIFNACLRKLKYPMRVVYKGIVTGEEKQLLIDSFGVFLHTSRHEGMPGAVLEAMARAVPCLVTTGTNMGSIVSESDGGWVCECSVKSISDSLSNINNSTTEIISRGLKARCFIEKNFLWSKIAERYLSQIKSIKKDNFVE